MIKEYNIDRDIYSEAIIIQAVSDFQDVGNITFSSGKIQISVDDEGEAEEIFNELMNYSIALLNS